MMVWCWCRRTATWIKELGSIGDDVHPSVGDTIRSGADYVSWIFLCTWFYLSLWLALFALICLFEFRGVLCLFISLFLNYLSLDLCLMILSQYWRHRQIQNWINKMGLFFFVSAFTCLFIYSPFSFCILLSLSVFSCLFIYSPFSFCILLSLSVFSISRSVSEDFAPYCKRHQQIHSWLCTFCFICICFNLSLWISECLCDCVYLPSSFTFSFSRPASKDSFCFSCLLVFEWWILFSSLQLHVLSSVLSLLSLSTWIMSIILLSFISLLNWCQCFWSIGSACLRECPQRPERETAEPSQHLHDLSSVLSLFSLSTWLMSIILLSFISLLNWCQCSWSIGSGCLRECPQRPER